VLPKLIPFCSWSSHAATIIIIIFFLSRFVFWSEPVFFPIGLPGPFLICTFLVIVLRGFLLCGALLQVFIGLSLQLTYKARRPVSDACSWPGLGSAVESPPGGFSHAQFAKTGLELDFFLAVGGAAVFLDCLIVKLPARFLQKKKLPARDLGSGLKLPVLSLLQFLFVWELASMLIHVYVQS
jgi:hypothetical protein